MTDKNVVAFPTENLQHGALQSYAPPTIEQALAMNIPDMVLSSWEEKIALAGDLSRDMVPGMTEFQIRNFVAGDVADRVTPYGVYHQVLRELGTRYTSILSARYEWEKNQARLRQLQASKMRLEYRLEHLEDDIDDQKKPWLRDQIEASLMRVEAEMNNILRNLPLAEVQLRDTVRQLVHYTEVWEEVRGEIDPDLSDMEMQRIEWEAKVLLRYFKGKLGYIPTQFDTFLLNGALETAMTMREYGFTNAQAREVGCELSTGWDKKVDEIIERDQLNSEGTLLPITGDDQLPNLIMQRRQMRELKEQHLERKFDPGSGGGKRPPPHPATRRPGKR